MSDLFRLMADADTLKEDRLTSLRSFAPDVTVRTKDYRIGCIGAGMIMAECHLAAYKESGFTVASIASRTQAKAQAVATRWGIPRVHATPEALIEDPEVEIIDLAYPPDLQPALIRHALKQPHIKAILAQKPLALSLDEAIRLRDEAAAAGKIVSVNQNMRYDQSMRVLKQILEAGDLGEIVFAQIDMHAIPHWQGFLEGYDRLTLANMSVHHLDVLRFLFGDPEAITTQTRKDPRTTFEHRDGITVSTLTFPSGVMAVSLEDVWSGPREEGYKDDQHIGWRVEGTQGVARGSIGWPTGAVSTLQYASTRTTNGAWVSPTWDTMWFPQAFIGVMEQLQHAVKTGEPPALSHRRQREDHGAGRGRLPVGRAEAHGRAVRDLDPISKSFREDVHHDAERHFHRLLPLRPRRDRQEDPQPRVQHRAARPALQGCRRRPGQARQAEHQAHPRHVPGARPADLRRLGLHQRHPSRPRPPPRERRAAEGDHPQRPEPRQPLRHLGNRHLQH